MTASKRRRYTAEERAAALVDVARLGVCGAAKAHGMPQSCVSRCEKKKKQKQQQQPAKQKRVKAARSPAALEAAVGVVTDRAKRAAARRYTPSQKAEAVEHAAAHGVSAASETLGISRFSIYGWMRQVAHEVDPIFRLGIPSA